MIFIHRNPMFSEQNINFKLFLHREHYVFRREKIKTFHEKNVNIKGFLQRKLCINNLRDPSSNPGPGENFFS